MALAHARPDFELTVHDNRAEALQPLRGASAGLTMSRTELARSSQVIAVCVRDDVELLAVAYGDGSLNDSIEPGAAGCSCTAAPCGRRPCAISAESLALRGGRVLDAAVTRVARISPRAATLCAMVGGDAADPRPRPSGARRLLPPYHPRRPARGRHGAQGLPTTSASDAAARRRARIGRPRPRGRARPSCCSPR